MGRKAGRQTQKSNECPEVGWKKLSYCQKQGPLLYRVFTPKELEDQTSPQPVSLKKTLEKNILSNLSGRQVSTNILEFVVEELGVQCVGVY